jgi:apoptosis-stimulating of p53 protein 1
MKTNVTCFVFLFRTSLHCAAANNSIEMCKFLINHGACVFAVTAIEGKTPSRCCEKESENFEQCFTHLSGTKTAEGIAFGRRYKYNLQRSI